jgi:hypothetical protein
MTQAKEQRPNGNPQTLANDGNKSEVNAGKAQP